MIERHGNWSNMTTDVKHRATKSVGASHPYELQYVSLTLTGVILFLKFMKFICHNIQNIHQ